MKHTTKVSVSTTGKMYALVERWMRQGGLILAAGCVRSKKKVDKNNKIPPHPKHTTKSTADRWLRPPRDGVRRNTSHALAHTRPLPRRATIQVAVFGQNVFWVTGPLNPKLFEFKSCVAIFFGVYPSYGFVHQVSVHQVSILFSSKISFWGV